MSGETSHDVVTELLRAFPRWPVWVACGEGVAGQLAGSLQESG